MTIFFWIVLGLLIVFDLAVKAVMPKMFLFSNDVTNIQTYSNRDFSKM